MRSHWWNSPVRARTKIVEEILSATLRQMHFIYKTVSNLNLGLLMRLPCDLPPA